MDRIEQKVDQNQAMLNKILQLLQDRHTFDYEPKFDCKVVIDT